MDDFKVNVLMCIDLITFCKLKLPCILTVLFGYRNTKKNIYGEGRRHGITVVRLCLSVSVACIQHRSFKSKR